MCESRINSLEQKLRESEKERLRYQNEANRIKEMMQRNVMSTRHAAQIGNYLLKMTRLISFITELVILTSTIFYSKSLQRNQFEPGKVETSAGQPLLRQNDRERVQLQELALANSSSLAILILLVELGETSSNLGQTILTSAIYFHFISLSKAHLTVLHLPCRNKQS